MRALDILAGFILAVASWIVPQPVHSVGLLVTYGGQDLVQANADWHGYDLAPYPGRCGLSGISPAMLGRIAWVRTDGRWIGPCLVLDVVARSDAYESIYLRQEVAEVSRATAAQLGFVYGAPGEVWFGVCPPKDDAEPASAYRPPLAFDRAPFDQTPSFYPYPAQQLPHSDCGAHDAAPSQWITLPVAGGECVVGVEC